MAEGKVEYARNGQVHLAFQVTGTGPSDVLLLPGGTIPMDALDKHAKAMTLLRRLQPLGRLILTDPRGIGQSDTSEGPLTPDVEADDLAGVLESCDARSCLLVAGFDACLAAIAYAARRPDRLAALVIVNGFTRYEAAMEDLDQLPADALTLFREMLDGAQTEVDMVSLAAPTERDDQHWRDWFDEAGRRGASPKWAARRWAAHETADISGYLGDITVPTVIIHREGNLIVSPRQADELAAAIPDAELRMLPGSDNLIYAGAVDEIVDAVLEFAGRPIGEGAHDRALLTVLFTDIVGSTDHVAELGDSRWATVLDVHDSLAGRVLERHRGTLVKTTGDGLLVTFDSPGDAVRCAAALRDDLRGLNIDSRSGIHVGEVERRTDDVGGIAVHLAARVMDQAEPAEILVSGAVPPLMLGTDITFVDKGTHDLKGVPGRWQLLAARI